MKNYLSWWKIVSVLLILYSIIAGFLIQVPALPILHETIRNLFFHVTMWFGKKSAQTFFTACSTGKVQLVKYGKLFFLVEDRNIVK